MIIQKAKLLRAYVFIVDELSSFVVHARKKSRSQVKSYLPALCTNAKGGTEFKDSFS